MYLSVKACWDYLHNSIHCGIAFAVTGIPTVFRPLMPLIDTRFLILKTYGTALTVNHSRGV